MSATTLRIGATLTRAVSALARNAAPAALLTAIAIGVPYAVTSWKGPDSAFGLTVEVFLAACLQAVLAVGVYETLQGRRPGALAFMHAGLARLPGALPGALPVIAAMMVLNLALELLAVFGGVPTTLATMDNVHAAWWTAQSWPALAPYLAAALALLAAYLLVFVMIPAAAVEGLGLTRGICRSVQLVRRSVLRVVGVVATTTIAGGAVLWFAAVSTADLGNAAPDVALSALVVAFLAVVPAVTYHDLRNQQEGNR